MAVPIYRFRNERQTIIDTTPTQIYGVTNPFMIGDVTTDDISAVVLTLQISNNYGSATDVSVYVTNGSTIWYLVKDYSILEGNAFDPLSGNLILTKDLTVVVVASGSTDLDIVMSLMEISNAVSI